MAVPETPAPALKPLELSFPLPKVPHTTLHMHLTFLTTSMMVFLTTATIGDAGTSTAAMGSFVYAMPDRTNSTNVLSTPLYSSPTSVDYANRAAKILARRTASPVYVGCSANFSGATVEEEMEGLTKVIDTIMSRWKGRQ